MRILSFDVGVKNLCGCLLQTEDIGEGDGTGGKVNVEWWDIVNLLDTAVETCTCKRADSSDCTKPAKWAGHVDGSRVFYCGTHKKRHADLVRAPSVTAGTGRCVGVGCSSVAKFAIHTHEVKLMCTKHKNEALQIHRKGTALREVKPIRCKDQPVEITKLNLWHRLDALPCLLSTEIVLIENQPSLKNPVMKGIAETLFSYFLCRGIVDRERTGSTIQSVKYVSPSNKLKVVTDAQAQLKAVKGSEKYKLTKQLSVSKVTQLLVSDTAGTAMFLANRKKDDLADSLLQAVAYLKLTHGAVVDSVHVRT